MSFVIAGRGMPKAAVEEQSRRLPREAASSDSKNQHAQAGSDAPSFGFKRDFRYRNAARLGMKK